MKRFFTIITFLCLFLTFSSPVLSQDSQGDSNQTQNDSSNRTTNDDTNRATNGERSQPRGQGEYVNSTGTTGSSTGLTCDDGTGIQTAIGCIHALGSQSQFLGEILRWAVGIGGGIAFLLIIYAGFMIMTSAGNPERLKAAQELLTSAISGLILLIFSVFILKFIGIDILGLDQFGFGSS